MIYFNNTATSYPKPEIVTEAVKAYLNRPPLHSSRTGIEHDGDDIINTCRKNIAKILNAQSPEQIVFTSGSTEALNLVIRGLDFSGGHIISTSIEHNSVIRPLKTLESEGLISVDFVPCDKYGYVKANWIVEAIRPDTKAIVVNHCSNVTGSIIDLDELSKIAKNNDLILIVDASQSAGLVPIDVDSWNIDYLAFTGHKNLFGLPGIGGLYMKKTLELKPLKTGGTGIKSEILLQPKSMPLYYEAGTPNMPGIVSLEAGSRFVIETGLEKIASHKASMVKYMIDELSQFEEIVIYTSLENNSLSNFCFNIEGLVPEEVNYILESSYDIHVRSGLHCAPLLLDYLEVKPWGTVRASPSYFTQEWEIEKFINAIKEIVQIFVRNKKRHENESYKLQTN